MESRRRRSNVITPDDIVMTSFGSRIGGILKLTKTVVDAAAYQGKQSVGKDGKPKWTRCVLWDGELKGFGLRITPSGSKSFILLYRPAGSHRQRQMTLGSYGSLTADQARKKAKRELGRIVDGHDPLEERQSKKAESREEPTIARVAERFLSDLPKRRKKKTGQPLRPSTIAFYRRILEKSLLPAAGSWRVRGITLADIQQLHNGLHHTPYQANHVLKLMSQLLDFAEKHGWRDLNSNPCGLIPLFPEVGRARKREVMLRPEQIRRLREVLAAEREEGTDVYPLVAIEAAFWLGWRLRSELLPLKWEDLDLERRVARLWDTKTADFEYRALPQETVVLIQELPKQEGNPYVFPGKLPGRHRTTVRKVWYRVRRRAGLTDLPQIGNYRVHDVRHNAVSWLLASGYSLKMAGAVVGYTSEQSTEIYSHFLTDHLSDAVSASNQLMRTASDAVS